MLHLEGGDDGPLLKPQNVDVLDGLEVGPTPRVLSDFAKLLIACPNAELRDCKAHVELAERLCHLTNGRNPIALETIGRCYAACGEVDAARNTITPAPGIAAYYGDQALVDAVHRTLAGLAEGPRPKESAAPPTP